MEPREYKPKPILEIPYTGKWVCPRCNIQYEDYDILTKAFPLVIQFCPDCKTKLAKETKHE